MNKLSQNRNLLLIIIGLVLLDVAVLTYFLWPKSEKEHVSQKDRRRLEMMEKLKKDAGFTEQQVTQYMALKDSQMNNLKPFFNEMRNKKDSLFTLVASGNASDSIAMRLTSDIALLQQQVDFKLYKTQVKLRELCTPEQLPKYDTLMIERIKKMSKQVMAEQPKK